MTREEAYKFLIDISYALGNMSIEYLTEKDGEKMREAIKTLKTPETITEFADRCRECGAKYGKLLKQQSCTDAISRQEAIDKMQELEDEDIKAYSCKIPEGFDGKRAIEALKALQPVTPQPKMGKWIDSVAIQGEIAGQIVKAFNCSECGAISVFRMMGGKIVNGDLCPNCGAKMQEIEE